MLGFFYSTSGFAGLVYEVLWARMLTTQFGVSTFGVVFTVAAFMLGLGIGSLLGTQLSRRTQRALHIFATLEIGIAIYAMLLPHILQCVGQHMEILAPQLSSHIWHMLQGSIAIGLLTIPACAMGMGFPLILSAVRKTPLSLGKLYGWNALGATLGALFPLWGLPQLGWSVSIRVTALLSLMVGVGTLILARSFTSQQHTPSAKIASRLPPRLLLMYAGIGAASLMLEIGWVRLYGMAMLRTEYVLAIILCVYLLGIALGSLLTTLPRSAQWLTWLPPIAGIFILFSLWTLPVLSAWIEHHVFSSLASALWSQALALAFITLPTTLALGAWLPLLTARFSANEEDGALLYGSNALGAALGAFIAGFISIPLIGTTATVVIAGILLTTLGLCWAHKRWMWLSLIPILLCALPVWKMPATHTLLPEALAQSRDLYLYEDAVALTHVVQQTDGQRLLLTDLQRMDASTEPQAVQIQMDQARLPLLLHPAPHSVLFLGLGTGISEAGSLPFPQLDRQAVEISQGAIHAATDWFAPANNNVMQSINVQQDDVRHFLSATTQHYDVIIGDLFHPDLAGVSSLLSIQQFQRARARLNNAGIFVQWLALNQFDIATLDVVLRSFHRVFPHAYLFMDGLHLALVGTAVGTDATNFADAIAANLARLSPAAQNAATGNEDTWTWLGRYWGMMQDENTGAHFNAVQDEWQPFIEFHLPRARYNGDVDLAKLLSVMLQRRPDLQTAMNALGVHAADKPAFERAYVSSELATRAWQASLSSDGSEHDADAVRLMWLAYQANPRDRWIASALADNMFRLLPQAGAYGLQERQALQRVLEIYPAHTDTLRALWHLERNAGNQPVAEQYRARLLAISPFDSEANTYVQQP